MQGKRPCAAETDDSYSSIEIIGSSRRQVFFVIGIVQTRPLPLRFIPPDQLFALAPRLAVGPR